MFNNFVDNEIVDLIVKNTNQYIVATSKGRYLQEYQTKPTDHVEIQAFSGVKMCNRGNADELYLTDGNAPEIFRLLNIQTGKRN